MVEANPPLAVTDAVSCANALAFMRHDGLCAIIGGYGYCSCGMDQAKALLTAKLEAALFGSSPPTQGSGGGVDEAAAFEIAIRTAFRRAGGLPRLSRAEHGADRIVALIMAEFRHLSSAPSNTQGALEAAVKAAFTFAYARGFQIAEETSRSCIGSIDDAWEEYQALKSGEAGL